MGAEYFITHIQHDELSAVPSEERRSRLLAQLQVLEPAAALTESMVVGISRVGACRVSDAREYTALLAALDLKRKKKNNSKDALIGETALRNRMTLVSADGPLCDVMRAEGGAVIPFKKAPNKSLEATPGHRPPAAPGPSSGAPQL
ncbi:MAG TPA: hypothetical protein VLW52_01305 [Opitutaceae bacterium]|nr:hypothetical protein [Opitutaceae bacterium]